MTERKAWYDTQAIAERNRLTVYDAAYLELAKREKIQIATLDQDLIRATQAESVEYFRQMP